MLEGKIAIVTGAGQGIGRSIALGLANEGATIAICARNFKAVEDVEEEIKSQGREALAVRADISVASDVNKLISAILSKFGRIDILVNNAGVDLLVPAIEMTEEQWDMILDVNLKGVFLCSQAVAKAMIKQKRGKVINIASAGAHGGIPGMAAYCTSKAGIIALTQVMAIEWAKYNIIVNSISPGLATTPMVQKLRQQSPKIYEQREKRIPLGRLAQMEDIVNLVIFLASQESDYITGQDIIIDGGLFATHPGFVQG